MLDTLFIKDFIDSMEQYFHFLQTWLAMKFSSTDKIAIRNSIFDTE